MTVNPTTGDLTSSCTDRAYTFNSNGNRTKLVTTTRPGGDCAAAGTAATVNTTGWDSADRPTTGRNGSGVYTYDLFGRQTTLPAADAPIPTGEDITLGYFDDDLPRTVTQGATSTTFTLDADGRRSTQATVDATGTTTTLRRYTDGGDNPAWVDVTAPGSGTATTRFTEGIGGDLSATIASDGGLIISLGNPHGDVVTTVDIPDDQEADTPATSISGWASYDEYGNTTTADAVDGTLGYGWLGTKQRATSTATAGLTLMGVRLYNAARGLFTSLDPIPGGNDTAYSYPSDPINKTDLDGQRWGFLRKKGFWIGVATAVSLFACAICTGIGYGLAAYAAINVGRKLAARDYRGAAWEATGVVGMGWTRGAKYAAARSSKRAAAIWKARRAVHKRQRAAYSHQRRFYQKRAARWNQRARWGGHYDRFHGSFSIGFNSARYNSGQR